MDDHDVVDTLATLIAFPTVSDRPVTAIAAYLSERAEAAGFSCELLETEPGKVNVIARAGPLESGGIALSGHMDVVPTDGQQWTVDPFALSTDGDRLLGRGAADMKGFIAAAVTAVGRIPVAELRQQVVLIWTHDEEVGCLGAQALTRATDRLPTPLPPETWIGEPTDMRVCRMHPGHTTIRIRCTGRPAHSSRPDLGLSAITAAAAVVQRLDEVAEDWKRSPRFNGLLPSPFPVMNVGRIDGGAAVNIVPEHCDLVVGIRPLPGQDGTYLVEEIRSAIAPIRKRMRRHDGDIDVELLQDSPSLLTADGTPLSHQLLPHSESHASCGAPFATDGGHLAKLGTQCLVFGPGSIDVAHRPDEHISCSAVHRTVDIIEQVLRDRCM